MAVHVSIDEAQPTDKEGRPYRHYNDKCATFLQTPASKRKTSVPNTVKLRERTVRCPQSGTGSDGCWGIYEKEVAERKSKVASGTRAAKGAKQPAKQKGGKAGDIAAKAAAARKKTQAQPAASQKKEEAEAEVAAASA